MQPPSPESDVLDATAPFLAAVTTKLDTAVAELEVETRSLADDPAFNVLFDELRAMVSGGKRVRPTFVYWGWRAAHGPLLAADRTVCAGAALELTHACALVHDDIMDASPMRRGRPTAHVRFASETALGDATEDTAHFGEAAALLLGDLALTLADRVFADGFTPDSAWQRAFAAFNAMRIEVTIGQYLDIVEGNRRGALPDTALAIASLKTARYTVERPLLVGSALAGSDAATDAVLAAYGRHVGIAFQLRDDLLGAFGDPAVTGKPIGVDFREGKQTYLLAKAAETGTAEQLRDLHSLVGHDDLDDASVETIQQVLRETGADALCEEEIEKRLADGLGALEGADLPGDAATALRFLAAQMAFRDS